MTQKSCPNPKNSRLKISPRYSGKDIARRIRRKESREIQRGVVDPKGFGILDILQPH
jgi:hypothetical protein